MDCTRTYNVNKWGQCHHWTMLLFSSSSIVCGVFAIKIPFWSKINPLHHNQPKLRFRCLKTCSLKISTATAGCYWPSSSCGSRMSSSLMERGIQPLNHNEFSGKIIETNWSIEDTSIAPIECLPLRLKNLWIFYGMFLLLTKQEPTQEVQLVQLYLRS